jgi:hypothetical protein
MYLLAPMTVIRVTKLDLVTTSPSHASCCCQTFHPSGPQQVEEGNALQHTPRFAHHCRKHVILSCFLLYYHSGPNIHLSISHSCTPLLSIIHQCSPSRVNISADGYGKPTALCAPCLLYYPVNHGQEAF